MAEPGPIAVGGVSGSGTRLVAAILAATGVYMGGDLNESLDNLWFTLLFKRPRWLPERLWTDDPELLRGLSILEDAMEGRLEPTRLERRYIERAARELGEHGHNNRGDGRGAWAEERVRSLHRSGDLRPGSGPWGWKEPCSMLLVSQIHRYFDDARYVHVMRHGLDMAFRADQQDLHTWGPVFGFEPPYPDGPTLPLSYWLAANEQVMERGEVLPDERFLVMRYEDLCRDPRAGIERLLAFAGIDLGGVDADRLTGLVRPSPWSGTYLRRDLSGFHEEDIQRVRALGFSVEGRPAARRSAPPRRAGPRVSVALCTYQGERFLPEQLSSLARQTRPPDELVVCDDGSTDGTVELLRRFRASAPFPVRLESNAKRLGSTKNFERAIGMCRGDLIFLADQDDVWLARKLERLVGVLARSPEVGAVFTDADLIDERSHPVDRGLWQTLGFEGDFRRRFAQGQAFELLVTANVVTGATMGFRSRYVDLLLPIPENWVQDAWIAILLAAVSELRVLPERLIRYRLHPGQQIGVPDPDSGPPPEILTWRHHAVRWTQFRRRMRKNDRERMRGIGDYLGPVVERLRAGGDRYPGREQALSIVEGMVGHMQTRGSMESEPHRWKLVVRELRSGRYHRYSSGVSSALKDLLLLDRRSTGEGVG